MGKLKERLSKKIPDWRYNYRQLLDEKGDQVTSTVTIEKAYSGMKGVKGMICDTSSVTAEAGLHVRGRHILDLVDLKPEEILYLLLIGDLPDTESLQDLQKELYDFLKDRFKYYMKEKQIRYDIIEASISSFSLNRLFSSFEKAKCLNKIINNQVGVNIMSSYKRASNILDNELKNNKVEIENTTDPGIFKNDFEKNLFKKINEIKKYYSTVNNDENYEKSLSILSDARKEVFDFFDNVKVNEENETLRKNRLELINMLCKTFQNFINFELLKSSNE